MRELETLLEEEKSQRAQALSIKKQMEAELQEAEAQVEAATRGREEALRQMKRLQVMQNFCKLKEFVVFDRFLQSNTNAPLRRKWSKITIFRKCCRNIPIKPHVVLQAVCAHEIFCLYAQTQMKEVLRELDETKIARDEIVVQSKDSEKRLQTLEAELLQLTEVR